MSLQWNVFTSDWNAGKIVVTDIFEHTRFLDDCRKNYRKNGRGEHADREAFTDQLRRDLMYYYWSKCEWEVVLSLWPGDERFQELKVDVYDQVRLNWDRFTDYVWENRKELGKK